MGAPAIMSMKIVGDSKSARKAFRDTENAAESFGGRMKALGGNVGTAFKVGLLAVPALATATVKGLYDIGAEFDSMSDTIRIGTGATGQALTELENVAKGVATSVPTSFENAGKIVADVNTRLGLTGKTLQTTSSQILELNRVLGVELNLEKATGAFNAFNITGESVTGSLDTLFRVSQTTGVEINKLTAAIQDNAPQMLAMGFSFDQTAAMVGLLDKSGLDANKMLGSMGKGMVTLARAGEQPSDAFKRITGELQGFITSGNDAAALNLASKLFGVKGAPQFIQALKSGSLNLETINALANGTGDTILSVGAETQDAAEKATILWNKVKLLLEPVASTVFSALADGLDWVINAWNNFDSSSITQAFNNPTIQAFAAYAGVAAQKIQALFVAMQPFITALWNDLLPAFESIGTTLFSVWDSVKIVFGGISEVLLGVLDLLTGLFSGDWEKAWAGVQSIVSGAWTAITGIIDGAWNLIKGIFTSGIQLLTAIWNNGWNVISQFISTIWEGIKNGVSRGIDNVISFISNLPTQIKNTLGNLTSLLYNHGWDVVTGFINGITGGAKRLWDKVSGFAGGIVSTVKEKLGINSPSKVFMKIGVGTAQGMAIGLASGASEVRREINGIANPPVLRNVKLTGVGNRDVNRAAPIINITVNGALDARSTARQIKEILKDLERSNGVVYV